MGCRYLTISLSLISHAQSAVGSSRFALTQGTFRAVQPAFVGSVTLLVGHSLAESKYVTVADCMSAAAGHFFLRRLEAAIAAAIFPPATRTGLGAANRRNGGGGGAADKRFVLPGSTVWHTLCLQAWQFAVTPLQSGGGVQVLALHDRQQ